MQNGLPVGFCYIVDKNGNSYRGFFKNGVRDGFGISDEIKDHYLKLNYSNGNLIEPVECFSTEK